MADMPVLILLGEPGIGKTTAITAERDSIRKAAAARGEQILWPDLQAVSTPEGFDNTVANTPEFKDWLKGEAILHLYLDALDECMLRVRTLGRLLMNALQHGPTDRLWLRLACRTAEWSSELERDLTKLLGGDRVKAFELLPLTRSDVATAVAANGIDHASFFDYVNRTEAIALASRPVSLDFLIRCFRRGDLPKSQHELYEQGCQALCEEFDHRMETGLAPAMTAVQRLAIAKRIAACTIFSTRSTLLLGVEDADTPPDAVRLNELAGESERGGMTTFEVTESALRDALDTGLFTSRGAKVLGWAHHAYQEYLAARYLTDRGLSSRQILSLIVHPDDPARKLTPQLHQVSAWLAALHSDIFGYVVEHEPEVILFSDVVVAREEDRARLVVALLKRMQTQQLARIDVTEYPKFSKLAHGTIAAQLRPILMGVDEPVDLREFAVAVARYAGCSELVADLTLLALDATQPIDVRIDAAGTVVHLGDEQQRAALKPLLTTHASRRERWLVRHALRGTWPHALTADELFAFMTPQNSNKLGLGDDYILVEQIRETLRAEDLAGSLKHVLGRVKSVPEGRPIVGHRDAVGRLEDAVVVRAWRSDDDAVTAALAEIAVQKIRRFEPLLFGDELEEDEITDAQLVADVARRRRFASFLLPALARRRKPIAPWIVFDKTPYLQGDDLPWLIERRVGKRFRPKEQSLEADLILYFADLSVPTMFDLVYSAARDNAVLAGRVRELCADVRIDSEEARVARRDYAEWQNGEQRRVNRRGVPRRTEHPIQLAEWLSAVEDDPCVFWRLLDEMSRKPGDRHSNSMNLDVVAFPGWLNADEGMRDRTIAAALRFIRECDPDADAWFGTNQYALSAMGGVRALMLLREVVPHKFMALESIVWKKWTPALLGIPNNDRNVPLLSTAYEHSPDEVIRRVQQLIRAKDAHVVRKLSDVVDDRLIAAIIDLAREGGFSSDTLTRMLEPLLESPLAREFAESLVRDNELGVSRVTAAALAAMLLLHTSNESWSTIWPLMTDDRDFGRAVIESAVNRSRLDATPVYVLEEERVAALYLWLTREYPPHTDPVRDGTYTPDTRDNLSSWRSRCLDSLTRRGTRAGCDALRRLAAELPAQTYLPPLIVEAESVRRQKSWEPTPIAALRRLLADSALRQVRSETELANVLVESLERLDARLQGETPAAFDLWNTSPKYKPRTENECSNYIARYLREDLRERGMILAREVEIRPTSSLGSGERVDIRVDVSVDVKDGVRSYSMIVEVKGCWNKNLHGDMTNQLARRYLRENATRTGLYLVCWFHSVVWNSSDRRKRACISDRNAIAASLAAEAARLRGEGYDVRVVVLNCSLR